MKIKIIEGNAYELIDELQKEFDNSRFNCEIKNDSTPRTQWVRISQIRLKESKQWCGSHPGACLIDTQKRKSKVLEGADWVEVNDRINDACDRLNISADIKSAVCIIRKGNNRRTYYGMYYRNFNLNDPEWNMDESDEHYEDWRGRNAPASWWPEGTPGLYERKVSAGN